MAPERSKRCCARRAKATFWVSPPITCSVPGASRQPVAGTASVIAQSLSKKAWRRLPAGEGTKGPRWHDWAYLELADLEASEYNDGRGKWTRGLLIRRNIADDSMAFFSTWCPQGTSM